VVACLLGQGQTWRLGTQAGTTTVGQQSGGNAVMLAFIG
jgi:hypothetical protein